MKRIARGVLRRLKAATRSAEERMLDLWMQYLVPAMSPLEHRMLMHTYDDAVALPPGAERDLANDHPRLQELREAYARFEAPVSVHSQWHDRRLNAGLNLRYFRGDNHYVWHYREWPRATILKYFIYARYIQERDKIGLLDRLKEDGAFGSWTFQYPGMPRVSRDLLDAANEITFLDRHLGILGKSGYRVLDIGAGYGRVAHRLLTAAPGVTDYCCVDAVPESTFLSEYYLRFRQCVPRARVVPLHEVDGSLQPDHFDLAVNIHSFSECTYDAVAWWCERLERLRIPNLLIIPNDPDQLLTTETDRQKRDFRPLIENAGYRLEVCEPVVADAAIRELLRIHDQFFLFRRRA
jgi:SAM-dependent methyltransferase